MSDDVKLLPVSERPRERLRTHGGDALSSEELLAILLGSGTKDKPVLKLARSLLVHFKSMKDLSSASVDELQQVPGIGPAKALKIKAAFTLAFRSFRELSAEDHMIKTSHHAFNIAVRFIEKENREVFLALLLNQKSHLIGVEIISVGTVSTTLAHPREVFFAALKRCASSLILVHNHPSGSLEPSEDDIATTLNIIDAGEMLNIHVIDHLIITPKNFYSLKEHGVKFPQRSDTNYVCSS